MRTVPFQSNSFILSIRLAIFWNTYFSEQPLFRAAVFHYNYLQEQLPEVFYEKLLLKISEYSQENTCVGVSFFR